MKNIKVLLTVALLCTLTLIVGCEKGYQVNDIFSIPYEGEPVTVWLDEGARLERNGKILFTAQQDMEIQLWLTGNYKILEKIEK